MDEFILIEEGLHADIYESKDMIKKIYDLPAKQAKKNCRLAFKLSQLIPEYVPKVFYYKAPILVMEKIEGKTLAKFSSDDTVTIYRVINSMIQAMLAMHSAGYSHLDLHPKNIIITEDHRAKLIDFDTARKIKRKDEEGELLVKSDYRNMKFHVANLIFMPLKNNIQSVSQTLRMTERYTVKDVIEYKKDPQFATLLYDIFESL